jgi:hypothetical protein
MEINNDKIVELNTEFTITTREQVNVTGTDYMEEAMKQVALKMAEQLLPYIHITQRSGSNGAVGEYDVKIHAKLLCFDPSVAVDVQEEIDRKLKASDHYWDANRYVKPGLFTFDDTAINKPTTPYASAITATIEYENLNAVNDNFLRPNMGISKIKACPYPEIEDLPDYNTPLAKSQKRIKY